MTEGIFRFIRWEEASTRLAQGWRVANDLGPVHGAWSVLMWWCIGACKDGEAPK